MDYLDRYKSRSKKSKRKGNVKIIDEDINCWNPVNEFDDDPLIVGDVEKFAFKTQDNWVKIQDAQDGKHGEEGDSVKRRRSPSRSPEIRTDSGVRERRSPSASPSIEPRGRRRSPSASPTRRKSPSQSPTKGSHSKARRSPSPSPSRRRRSFPSHSQSRTRKRRSPSPSPSRTRKRRSPSPEPTSKVPKMSDGTSAGLQSNMAIKQDLMRQKQEQLKAYKSMDPSLLGKDAPTIHRDKIGKKINPAELKAQELTDKRAKDAREEAKMEWGKGLVQAREKDLLASRLALEKDADFSVYIDDSDRNAQLKTRDRWGDPMAFMATTKKDFDVYRGPKGPPNRFDIAPGRKWDGVDRGNGFEHKFFQHQHASKVYKEEFHQWSTEDM